MSVPNRTALMAGIDMRRTGHKHHQNIYPVLPVTDPHRHERYDWFKGWEAMDEAMKPLEAEFAGKVAEVQLAVLERLSLEKLKAEEADPNEN